MGSHGPHSPLTLGALWSPDGVNGIAARRYDPRSQSARLSVEAGTAGTDLARVVFDGAGGVYIDGPARPSRARVSGNRSVNAMPYRYTYGESKVSLRPITPGWD